MIPIPALPRIHAIHSKTFRPPAMDGSLTLPEIYDWHSENTPNHRVFVLSDDNQNTRSIYWPEAVQAVHNGAHFLRNAIGVEVESQTSSPVVAILAASDTVTYFTMIMAIMRAGYVAFPISPRNSSSAVAHLIKAVGVHHILVGSEQSMQDLAKESLQCLRTDTVDMVTVPQVIPMPDADALFGNTGVAIDTLPSPKKGSDEVAIYLHSSGSTAYPKPIPFTTRRCVEVMLIPYFGERDLTNKVLSVHSMPMYHGMGFMQCCWTAACGLVLSTFEPKSPAKALTTDNQFHSAVATETDIILCVPSIIETWSRNEDYVKWLATRDGVLCGGGPLNKSVGDYLVSKGVSIFTLYGSSEGGIMSQILPATVGYDWEYFKLTEKVVTPEMVPHGDNTYELVMISNEFCHPAVINTKVNGLDAYETSDLMSPHPTKAGYWKIYGRSDDQIMHSTGEKTNPGPLETILNQDPHVQSSVMFGRGKFQAGVLIDPKAEFAFDTSNEDKLSDFRNKIWPTIQKMNKFAPQHSRLFKEMVLIVKSDKPFQYTAKSTARRQAIINQYEPEIEALYAAVDATTQSNIQLPDQWDIVSATDFVREVVKNVLLSDVKDDYDIFQHGCDSLQATWIRNTLTRALRDAFKLDARKDTNNFVYDHPSISRLASFLVAFISGNDIGTTAFTQKQHDMEQMAAKYSANFPNHIPTDRPQPSEKVVLLTGSTGGLGSHVLAELVADENVTRIYCINRPSRDSSSLLKRQKDTLVHKGLPLNILDSTKVVLLEAQLDEQRFGLEKSVYDEMQRSVIYIIHNAWTVDFNLSLASFEPNVKGLRHLIDFALSSSLACPPAIVYTSTIGVFQNPASVTENLLESPVDAKVAVGTGYSESKWVCEQILASASSHTDITAVTVRVGQICGGLNGYWNTKEWFPAVVQSAKFVSCLPKLDKNISWIPIQIAARSLIDFMQSPESAIVHLVHPNPVQWSTIGQVISSELRAPLLPYHEWMSKLEHLAISYEKESNNSVSKVAALRLLKFYRSIGLRMNGLEGLSEAFGMAALDVARAVNLSPTLAMAERLEAKDARLWLAYWRSVCFI